MNKHTPLCLQLLKSFVAHSEEHKNQSVSLLLIFIRLVKKKYLDPSSSSFKSRETKYTVPEKAILLCFSIGIFSLTQKIFSSTLQCDLALIALVHSVNRVSLAPLFCLPPS